MIRCGQTRCKRCGGNVFVDFVFEYGRLVTEKSCLQCGGPVESPKYEAIETTRHTCPQRKAGARMDFRRKVAVA